MPEPNQGTVILPDPQKPQDGIVVDLNAPTEGSKKKETTHEPPPGSERWNEVYFKMKDNERKATELEAKLRESDADVEAMRREFKSLTESVKDKSGDDGKVKAKDTQSRIRELRTQQIQAAKDMDFARDREIQAQIDDLMLEQLNRSTITKEEIKETIKEISKETRQEETTKAVRDFVNNTDWYNPNNSRYDPYMAGAMDRLDAELLRKGFHGTDTDRYKKAKEEVEKKFGWKVEGTNMPSVEAGGGTPPAGTVRIKLSDDERITAHKMFRDKSPEEAEKIYATEKAKIQKARGK